MRYGKKCRRRAWVLAAVVVCVAQTACSKGRPPDQPAGAAGHVGRCTLTGNFREANEDAVAVHEFQGATLCLVADGMGGEAGLGRAAADRAVEVLARELKATLPGAATADENQRLIRRAVVAANEDMMVAAAADPGRRNVGATVALALWRPGDAVYVAGVGDTRAYLIRGDRIEQLTADHTLALALVEAKTITPEEAKTHRFRNVLWKYLGSKEVGDGPEGPIRTRATGRSRPPVHEGRSRRGSRRTDPRLRAPARRRPEVRRRSVPAGPRLRLSGQRLLHRRRVSEGEVSRTDTEVRFLDDRRGRAEPAAAPDPAA